LFLQLKKLKLLDLVRL